MVLIPKEKKRKTGKLKKIVAIVMVGVIALSFQWIICEPQKVHGAAGTLEVRVGYFGDSLDYRVKATFTKGQLEAMGAREYWYANITSVGTVMETVAYGVPINTILSSAGISLGSAQTLNLRTTDGQGSNSWFTSLNMGTWVNATKYHYPNLRKNYDNSQGVVIPNDGGTSGRYTVPSILAIKSYSTKSNSEDISSGMMTEKDSYRFCSGQGNLVDGVANTSVTSKDSATWITGIDITLSGSPKDAADLNINIQGSDIKVGSSKQASATVLGEALFQDLVDQAVTWTTSDEAIATVDSSGKIAVHKEGRATITATTANGIKKSIVINGTPGKNSGNKGEGAGDEGQGLDSSSGEKSTVSGTANLSGLVEIATTAMATTGTEGTKEEEIDLPPEKRNPYGAAAATGLVTVCGAGGIALRIRKFKHDI